MNKKITPVCMAEECWANSQLSVVRHFGEINFNGHHYIIVNKEGISVLELSNPKSKYYAKSSMAIPAGEPCDLILADFQSYYRSLGRDAFLEVLKEKPSVDLKVLKRIYKEKVRR